MTLDRIDKNYFQGGSHITDSIGEDLAEILDEHADVINRVIDTESETPLVLYVDTNGDDSNSGLALSKPKRTVNGAIDSLPLLSQRHAFIKIGAGTYDEEINLGQHKGPGVHLMGGLTIEHTGTVDDYKSTGLNPVGFHQVQVSGFTFESDDDQKWLRFEFDDGTCELVKILTVLSSTTVEVGAARLSGKDDAFYEDTGIGGHCEAVHVVSESVTIGASQSYVLRVLDKGPSTLHDTPYMSSFYSFFGIKFQTNNTYGSALYFSRGNDAYLSFACCSLRCPSYFSLYVAMGSFQIFCYTPNGYFTSGSPTRNEMERLADGAFSNLTSRCGLYLGGSVHVYQSPTAWLNIRSTVIEGTLYTGDWQSFALLYPREHGLVIKKTGLALRVDDRGGLMIRGKILMTGQLLGRMLSDISYTNDLTIEWRTSTGAPPIRFENGCRVGLGAAVMTIDNDEAGERCIEIDNCPSVDLGAVSITGAPTGVAAVSVAHSHLHLSGAFSAPTQDYGDASAGGGIVHVGCHSDVTIEGAATGKNTNAGNSDPLVVRTLSSVCLPASGYDLKDNADANTVYLGALGSGQAIPASGLCKNDLVANPTSNEELVAVYRK